MAAITIRGLTKRFSVQAGEMAAIDALDLDVADNQFVTLVGPSGCGKTTTLRLIAGFMKPDSGTIHVGDRLLSSSAGIVPPEARGMGMVFQNYAVWPHKTVFENVAFGLRIRRQPAAEIARLVDKALDLVNLGGLGARMPSELSGGQQQRVALARSLVVEPEILLLDEPLSNLDAKLRERMRSELKQLQRRTGITFIYVTHDQAEALALSDQMAVIHGGRLQQFGAPADVYCAPANKTVATFMGQVNVLPGTVAADGLRIDLADGSLSGVPVPAGFAPGDSVDLIVRPESVRIATAEAQFPAKVVEQVFLGNINEIHVALGSGLRLQIQGSARQRFAAGDRVGIAIAASECSVFRR